MVGNRGFNFCAGKGSRAQIAFCDGFYFQSRARQSRICVAVTDSSQVRSICETVPGASDGHSYPLIHYRSFRTRKISMCKLVPRQCNCSINFVSVQSIHVTFSSCIDVNPIHWAVIVSNGKGSLTGPSEEGYQSDSWRPAGGEGGGNLLLAWSLGFCVTVRGALYSRFLSFSYFVLFWFLFLFFVLVFPEHTFWSCV